MSHAAASRGAPHHGASSLDAPTPAPGTVVAWDARSLHRLAADSPRYTPLAILLALATIPVLGALALDARLLHGLSVWVKPLKFLVALVVYLLTLAWFARYAAPEVTGSRWWRWHERAVVVAIVLEMIWIGGAAAMGAASHFDVSTPLRAGVYGFMGMAAVLLTSASGTLAWAIHRGDHDRLPPAIRSGLVAGLALTMTLTLASAGVLSGMGSHWIGGTPSDAGGLPPLGWSRDGGDLRVAHFFATHAMHAVPLAGWLSARFFGPDARGPVRLAALIYAAFVAFAFVQALMGRPFVPG